MANLIFKSNFDNVSVSGRQLTPFPINHSFVTETGVQYSRIWMDDGTHETDSPPMSSGLCVGVEKQSGADRIEFNLNNITSTVGKNEFYIKYRMYLQSDFAVGSGGWFSLMLPYQMQDSPWYPYAAIQIFNEASGVKTLLKLMYGSDYFETFWYHYPPLGRWFDIAYYVRLGEGTGILQVWLDGQQVVNLQGYSNLGAGGRFLVTLAKIYTGDTRTFKIWVDDLEIWDGLPGPTNPTLTVNSNPQGVPFTYRKVG